MFELLVQVIAVRDIVSKKDGKEYSLVELGVPETYEKFSVFLFHEGLKKAFASSVGKTLVVRFKVRGGYGGVSLQVLDIAP